MRVKLKKEEIKFTKSVRRLLSEKDVKLSPERNFLHSLSGHCLDLGAMCF